MGKRKLPFGYILENGDIKIELHAQRCVLWIYNVYASGASLSEIASELNEQWSISYDKDKPWNKNMIDRILQDQRYSGDALYPSIISERLFEAVQNQRAVRCGVPRQTEVQKALRDLGTDKASGEVNIAVLSVLNRLISDPGMIHSPTQERVDQTQLFRTRRELYAVMAQQPINEDKAAQLILRQAEAEYAMLCDDEYETERLRRLFSKTEPMKELSADMLRLTVAKISVEIKKVSVTLKNNQVIEVSDLS